MDIKAFLKALSEASGVSGYEDQVREIVRQEFARYADEVRTDAMGNVIALVRSTPDEGAPRRSIMLAGHMDEIGLMVTVVDKGFLRFTTVGGFDVRTLLGQQVVVHGSRDLPGIIGARPPHVLPEEERDKVVPLDDLLIDVGLSEGEVSSLVKAGDFVTIQRPVVELQRDYLAGKGFDDRAAVAAIADCLARLVTMHRRWDVYAVATVQEEVGLKGAVTSAYGLAPDVGVAIDVGFGRQAGLSEAESIEMGKGPAIAFGPNIHPKMYEKLVEVAKANELPYQIEAAPGPTGTDARAIQVAREGIPTALLSIPLRNMHTAVETLSVKDVERTGRLLAAFIVALNEDFAQVLGLPTRQ
ncbi:MAG: M42 family metallopeptidase [Chloroflexi bacterium]|nr:M42 family metallopeptidase [Chloroflexota bacterium]